MLRVCELPSLRIKSRFNYICSYLAFRSSRDHQIASSSFLSAILRLFSCPKYEVPTFAMIFRRLARPITVLVALWCLWQISKSRLKTLFPLIGKLIVANGTDVTPLSKVAKATVAANSLNSSFVHQALQTHKVQNDIHGYTHFIATNELVGDISETDPKRRPRGAWSKPAYLLSIIVAELAKPKNDRLGWVLYVPMIPTKS
jgi:hypothetical protein